MRLFSLPFLLTSLLLSALGLPWPLWAAQTLRVSILENTPVVLLESPDGMTMGDTRTLTTAKIGVAASGLTINGQATSRDMLPVRPRTEGNLIAVNGRGFSGHFRIYKKGDGLVVVNDIPVESYLLGVVPSEMPPGWPAEALKAQAVISRTYALYQKKARQAHDYDLASTVLDQVYAGVQGVDPRASAAIGQTTGEVLTYDGALALTFFHSTSAGPTEDAADHWDGTHTRPYLAGVSCPMDRDSPYYRWKRKIPRVEIERLLREDGYPVGRMRAILPVQWSRAGRMLWARVVHDGGEMVLRADDLRRAVGYRLLPSTRFQVDAFGKIVKISGMGYGHGVGLCQWGAKALAERGWRYDEILRHYYPGVTLQTRPQDPS